ncbi:MPN527 family putative ECF transporter permease subunit [Mycoplasma seminis]|uniref:ECF transporter S component n=1 Tax=Mycoplasma seminis TaxID=512749 RepID=A0ABY9H9V7_9MOLU|nr:hypothetical protein [Mycoplasma seminis]WLP85317.1 hypothetical protein Q8852_03265 [Mycoplasma seminis]
MQPEVKTLKWNYDFNTIYKIAFSGIMLALSIILSFICNFLKFNAFLNFNFALIPIFITLYYIGLNFALLVTFARFLISPILSAFSLSLGLGVEYLGNFILFCSQIVTLLIFFHIYNGVSKRNNSRFLISNLIAMVISMLSVAILMSILNTFLFNLIYFKMLGYSDFSLASVVKIYDSSLKAFFFFIPNYYLGSFTLYFLFNLTNIFINFFIIYIFIAWENKSNFINKINSKHTKNSYN